MVYKSGHIFLPFCHNTRVWQTDRRTDRILITIPRLHYMQRGKNIRRRCFLPYSVYWTLTSRTWQWSWYSCTASRRPSKKYAIKAVQYCVLKSWTVQTTLLNILNLK